MQERLEKLSLVEKNIQDILSRESDLAQERVALEDKIKEQAEIIENLNLSLSKLTEQHDLICGRVDQLIERIEQMDGVSET